MLKRAIVSLMLLGWLCQAGPSFADHYSDGVAAYQAHNYGRSAQLLQTALKEGKGSPDALFYLG
ncbi:hypothetical protein, partial [Salmonella enterica]|uniref:hypothetical protein n=1 Tax=Salmonella enterica TaxID=28901 RepID=UPI003D28369F